MKITSLSATYGTGFNDPHESFRNHRIAITLTADLETGDDPDAARRDLQRRAHATGVAERERILATREIEEKIAYIKGGLYIESPASRDRLLNQIDRLNQRADQLGASYRLSVSPERRAQIAAIEFGEKEPFDSRFVPAEGDSDEAGDDLEAAVELY